MSDSVVGTSTRSEFAARGAGSTCPQGRQTPTPQLDRVIPARPWKTLGSLLEWWKKWCPSILQPCLSLWVAHLPPRHRCPHCQKNSSCGCTGCHVLDLRIIKRSRRGALGGYRVAGMSGGWHLTNVDSSSSDSGRESRRNFDHVGQCQHCPLSFARKST